MTPDRIPKFSDLNRVLADATGWQIVCVPGLIPEEAFFALLAARSQRWLLAFPLLSLAVLVKFIPLLLGPLFLLAAWPTLCDRARR